MIVTVSVSDTHINSYSGLCTPYFEHHGGTHKANQGQRLLWHNWLVLKGRVQEVSKANNDAPIMLLLVGDICDVIKKSTNLITYNTDDMMRLTIDALRPLVDIAKWIYVVDGTPLHVESFEDKVAEDIGAIKEHGEWAVPRVHADIDGVITWAGHHSSMGRLPWTQGNTANRTAVLAKLAAVDEGVPIPHVVYRAHNHISADSGNRNVKRTRAIHMGCWQLPTEHVYRLNPDAVSHINAVIQVSDKKQYEIEWFDADMGRFQMPLPTRFRG